MRKSKYKAGTFLYKKDSNLKESKRVFLHSGYVTADGYGVIFGFTEDGILCKSSGHGNYQYGGDVRIATLEEIDAFTKEVILYQDPIREYSL